MISPKLYLLLSWDSYLVKLSEAKEYNIKQEEVLAEYGYCQQIEMPLYDSPLEMAAGGVWQKVVQIIK